MNSCINLNDTSFKALVKESGLHPAILSAKMGVWMEKHNTEEWPTLKQLGVELEPIKDGVDFVFEQNPELTKIGTRQQYSKYLDTIFPNSKLRQIYRHGTSAVFDKFDLKYFGKTDTGDRGYAFYFSPNLFSSVGLDPESDYAYVKYVLLNSVNPYYKKKEISPEFYFNRTDKFGDINQKIEDLNRVRQNWISKANNNDIDYAFFLEFTGDRDNNSELIDFIENKIDNRIDTIKKEYEEIKKMDINISGSYDSIVVDDFEVAIADPDKIHILGSKSDIEGFKEFVEEQANTIMLKKSTNSGYIGMSEEEIYNDLMKGNFTKIDNLENQFSKNKNGYYLDYSKKIVKQLNDAIHEKSQLEVVKGYADGPNGTEQYPAAKVRVKQSEQDRLRSEAKKIYEALNKESNVNPIGDILAAPTDLTHSKAFSATKKSRWMQYISDIANVSLWGSKEALRVSFEVINHLSERTGIGYKFISLEEAMSMSNNIDSTTPGFYNRENKTAYFIDGQFGSDTAFHEIFSHAFLQLIKDNPETRHIFDELYNEAISNKEFINKVINAYGRDFTGDDLKEEIVANYIDEVIKYRLINDKTKSKSSAFDKLLKKITEILKQIFNKNSSIDQIRVGSTVQQITDWLLYDTGKVNLVDGAALDAVNAVLNNDSKNATTEATQMVIDFGIENNLEYDEAIEILKNQIEKPSSKNSIMLKRTLKTPSGIGFSKFAEVKQQIVTGLKAQLSSLERQKDRSKLYLDNLKRLIADINMNEDYLSLSKFISNGLKELNRVSTAMAIMQLDIENGRNIDETKLVSAKTNFIDLYSSLIKSIQALKSSDDSIFDGLSKEEKDQLNSDVDRMATYMANIESKYKAIYEYQYKKLLRETAANRGDAMVDAIISFDVFRLDRDLSDASLFFGSASFTDIPQIQALNNILSQVKAEALDEFNSDPDVRRMIEIGNKLKKENRTWTSFFDLYEKDENGKPTGYLISPINYGLFLIRLNKLEKSLNKKYGVKIKGAYPSDPADRKAYIDAKEKFLSENVERMFTPEYYKIKNSLSEEASNVLDLANDRIRRIIDPFINPETGKLDTTMMTQDQYGAYIEAKQLKKNLSNITNLRGELKVGGELSVALEIKAMNDALSGNVKYKPNTQAFEEAKKKASKLSKGAYTEWLRRNTRQEIDESFYDKLASLEKAEQTQEWKDAYDKRRAIQNDWRHPDKPDTYLYLLMPIEVQEELNRLDEFLDSNRTKFKGKRETSFDSFAEVEKTEAYLWLEENARKKGNAEFTEFLNRTHYWVTLKGGTKERRLMSIYTRIVPKDKSLIKEAPSAIWGEVDTASNFYNPNYNPNATESGYQPKKSIYDNSTAYNKAMQNSDLKDLHEAVLNMNRKANKMYHYMDRPNPYRLAQISGGFIRKLTAEKNIFSGAWSSIKDLFRVESDDLQFGEIEYESLRADGKTRKNIPTSYRKMLDNPGSVSRNLPSITTAYLMKSIEFKHKAKREADIEIIRQGIEQTKVTKHGFKSASRKLSAVDMAVNIKNLGVEKAGAIYGESMKGLQVEEGSSSNVTKMAEYLIDRDIYGITNKSSSAWISKFGDKLISFGRLGNLAFNWPVIFSNFAMAETALMRNATTKFYLTPKSLRKAAGVATWQTLDNTRTIVNPEHHNKMVSTMRYFGIMGSVQDELESMHGNRLTHTIAENFWFGPYTAGDFAIKSQMLVALLLEYKHYTDPNTGENHFYSRRDFINEFYPGREKDGATAFDSLKDNLYDAIDFNKKNGALSAKPGFESAFTKDMIADVMIKADRMASSIDGMFTKQDKSKFGYTLIGKLLLMHRSWLVLAIQERLAGTRYDYEQAEFLEGQYLSVYRKVEGAVKKARYTRQLDKAINTDVAEALKAKLRHLKEIEEMIPSRKANVRSVAFEISTMVLLGLLANILAYYQDDEDEKELEMEREDRKKSVIDWAYLLTLRLTFEMNSLYWVGDTYSLIKSPTAATPLFDQIGNNIDLLLNPSAGDEIISSGAYKGDTKRFRALVKVSPFKNLIEYNKMTDISDKEKYMTDKFLPAYNMFDWMIESDREKRLNQEKLERQERLKEKDDAESGNIPLY